MPRLPSASKEHPRKGVGMSASMQALRPFVPCFFDVPFKDALAILGRSHHTLDPIRRAMDLDRWPFAEIMKGGFCDRDEIVALRAQMMSHAPEDMQRSLCLAATRAEECWRGRKSRRRRTHPPTQRREGAARKLLDAHEPACQQPPNSPESPPSSPSPPEAVPSSSSPPDLHPCSVCQQPTPSCPACRHPSPFFAWDGESDEEDRAFWDDMRTLFDLKEAVTPDPC